MAHVGRGEEHFEVRGEVMEANCARCGRKVKSEENWLRAVRHEVA